jgi:hypothetical protein
MGELQMFNFQRLTFNEFNLSCDVFAARQLAVTPAIHGQSLPGKVQRTAKTLWFFRSSSVC